MTAIAFSICNVPYVDLSWVNVKILNFNAINSNTIICFDHSCIDHCPCVVIQPDFEASAWIIISGIRIFRGFSFCKYRFTFHYFNSAPATGEKIFFLSCLPCLLPEFEDSVDICFIFPRGYSLCCERHFFYEFG